MKRQLEQKKMLILIAAKPLQRMAIETLAPRGIGGYTISTVTGSGTSGLNTGTLPSDSNVMIHHHSVGAALGRGARRHRRPDGARLPYQGDRARHPDLAAQGG